MDTVPAGPAERLKRERAHNRRARQDAVRRNAEKGIGRNIEEALRLARAASDFRTAFRTPR